MTAYATLDELQVRFGVQEMLGIADRDLDGMVDTAVVTAAIEAASNLIDSYIGQRYALPLDTVPGTLKAACQDLARYELYTMEPTAIVKQRRDQAVAWLKDLAAGRAALDAAAVTPPAPADGTQSGVQILSEPGDRRVSRAELRRL